MILIVTIVHRIVVVHIAVAVRQVPLNITAMLVDVQKREQKLFTGLSGDPEYYCQEHYDEMQSIIGDMEEDVGSGSYSTHKCEECSKEGTHELTGLDGRPEYYCTEHYNQLVDIVNELYGN